MATYWSPRFSASFSAWVSSLSSSRLTCGWPDWPLTCGRFFSAASTELRRAEMRTPARSSSARPEPSGWAMMAASTWIGSM